jgi:hypothetical protein
LLDELVDIGDDKLDGILSLFLFSDLRQWLTRQQLFHSTPSSLCRPR